MTYKAYETETDYVFELWSEGETFQGAALVEPACLKTATWGKGKGEDAADPKQLAREFQLLCEAEFLSPARAELSFDDLVR